MRLLQALVNRIRAWFRPKRIDHPVVESRADRLDDVDLRIPPPVPHAPIPRKRKDDAETLSSLLDGIHGTFDSLRLPDARYSFLSKRDMKALRVIGVHVPHPWLLLSDSEESDIRVDVSKGLPNTVCVAMTSRSMKDGGIANGCVPPSLFFAIKQSKIGPYYTQHPGTPYVFGFGYEQCRPGAEKMEELWWLAMMGTIDRGGGIHFCDELRTRQVEIPCKTPSERRSFGRTRTIHRRQWDTASYLKIMVDHNHALDDLRRFEKNTIRQAFMWWSQRTQRWSVAVTHGKHRVTFGINQENTKRFFADRDKTVKARDGRAKKIIHYVRDHERVLADGRAVGVREHIRGLREFDWQNFHCLVTAPQFHGFLATAIFDSQPIDLEDLPPGHKGLDAEQVASMLVQMESDDARRHRRGTIH